MCRGNVFLPEKRTNLHVSISTDLTDMFLREHNIVIQAVSFMEYKSLLMIFILILSVFALGCIENTDSVNKNGVTGKPPISKATMDDLIPVKNLPIGLTYLGVHEASLGNLGVTATEAIYKNSDGEDFYVRVVKTENTDAAKQLIEDYKSEYSNYRYEPFEEVVLNNHSATQIKENTLQEGKRVFTYSYLWNNENYVFIVSGNKANDNSLTFKLARAVGY